MSQLLCTEGNENN